VDKILDTAGQKGHGQVDGHQLARPRHPDHPDGGSGLFPLRERVEGRTREGRAQIEGPAPRPASIGQRSGEEEGVHRRHPNALYASKIVSYAQGYMLMRAAAKEYGWSLNYGGIALMWRGGCIIRSRFLGKIKEAFDNNPKLANLLLDDYFRGEIKKAQKGWRNIVATAVQEGHPRSRVQHRAGVLRQYRSARPAGEPAPGPARLLRRAHLRARGQTARRILPHQLDRSRRHDQQQHV
jgi:6-phosphogluconate dehydrogenase